jgi:hypothetical protein
MVQCKWITKHKTPCTRPAIQDKYYCITHSHYEGVYTPEDIPFLKKCSNCTQFVKPNAITRQCPKCFNKHPIRLCKWNARSGKPCSYSALKHKTCCKAHSEFETKNICDYTHCTKCRLYYPNTHTKCSYCYPPNNICKAFTKYGKPCTHLVYNKDSIYCGVHSRYEGKIEPGDFVKLPICTGCSSYFHPDKLGYKTCSECRSRPKIISHQQKTKCEGVTQKGTICTNFAQDGDIYCREHQTYKRWKHLEEQGKHICKNWIRGCWNEIKETHYSRCEKCRSYEREQSKLLRNIRQTNIDTHVRHSPDTRLCITCNKIKGIEFFTSTKQAYNPDGTVDSIYTKNCNTCRRKIKWIDMKRNTRYRVDSREYKDRTKTYNSLLTVRYSQYKHTDSHLKCSDKYKCTLDRTLAYKLMSQECTYCKREPTRDYPNGLDRLDNTKGHIIGNVVPCCETCNMMKKRMNIRTTGLQIKHQYKVFRNIISPTGICECPF